MILAGEKWVALYHRYAAGGDPALAAVSELDVLPVANRFEGLDLGALVPSAS